MAEEISFYSDQSGVRVTDKRVIVGNTTYSLANITSVSTTVEKPSLTGPVLFIVIGLLLLVGGLRKTIRRSTTHRSICCCFRDCLVSRVQAAVAP